MSRSDVVFFAVVVGFVQVQCSSVRRVLHAGSVHLSGDYGGCWSPSVTIQEADDEGQRTEGDEHHCSHYPCLVDKRSKNKNMLNINKLHWFTTLHTMVRLHKCILISLQCSAPVEQMRTA